MKSKTSFFNSAIFRNNITRFSPAWGLYTIYMLMLMLLGLGNAGYDAFQAQNMVEMIEMMALTNFCYCILLAVLLFGDLFNPRMCNALHAMPTTRDCRFMTNLVSGFLFALVPNFAAFLLALPILGTGWLAACWWLLGSMLEFVFFFGAAVLSVMCAGNLFCGLLVYGIINLLSLLPLWFAQSTFVPLMYGIENPSYRTFLLFAPLAGCFQYRYLNIPYTGYPDFSITGVHPAEGWGYLCLCAVVGIGFALAALLLYRRRRLEAAGDFLAIKQLRWVFLPIFSLAGGAFFQMCSTIIGSETPLLMYLFLLLGMAVAYFVGLMLMQRQTKVFSWRAVGRLGILVGAFAIAMVLTGLDVFGVVHRIPAPDQIEGVYFLHSYMYNWDDYAPLEDAADVENMLCLHRDALAERDAYTAQATVWDWLFSGQWTDPAGYHRERITLVYRLKDGKSLHRVYSIPVDRPAGQIALDYMNRPEYVLHTQLTDVGLFAQSLSNVRCIQASTEQHLQYDIPEAEVEELLEAIIADCNAGTMAQSFAYQIGSGFVPEESFYGYAELYYEVPMSDGMARDCERLVVYPGCENTLRWLTEHGYFDPSAVSDNAIVLA